MRKLRKFLAGIAICTVAFSNIALADTASTKEDQGDAVLEYMRIMDNFASTKGTTAYPDYYAGAYLDNDQKLVILTTDGSTARNGLPEVEARFETRKYSLNSLNEIMDTITAYIENNKQGDLVNNISGFGTDEMANKVFVSFVDLSDKSVQEFKEQVSNSDAIVFEQRDKSSTEAANLGSEIYFKTGATTGKGYSMGFRAQRVVNGVARNGFVTSGHGGMKDGNVIYDSANNRIGITSGVKYNSDTDACFIYADSQSISSKTVAGFDVVGNHYVTSFLTKALVQKEGATTGFTIGYIKSNNYTSITSDGMTVYKTILADYKSAGGDSGGIVTMIINGDCVPAGIHRASSSGTASFVKVQSVIDGLGVIPY